MADHCAANSMIPWTYGLKYRMIDRQIAPYFQVITSLEYCIFPVHTIDALEPSYYSHAMVFILFKCTSTLVHRKKAYIVAIEWGLRHDIFLIEIITSLNEKLAYLKLLTNGREIFTKIFLILNVIFQKSDQFNN